MINWAITKGNIPQTEAEDQAILAGIGNFKVDFKNDFFSRRCAIYTANDANENTLRPTTILRTRNSGRSTSSSEGEITDPEQQTTSARHHQKESALLETQRPPLNAADAGLIPQIDKFVPKLGTIHSFALDF